MRIKQRKLNYSLGDLNQIEVPIDWRKAQGIVAKRTEKNMGLAERDYNIKCGVSSELIVVEGYHLWWCHIHNQPHAWCVSAKLEEKLFKLKKRLADIIELSEK